MTRLRIATAWFGGCSGCHMSFLDLDEWLFDLAAAADIVYSPIADPKIFPEGVDVALVEGAVTNEEQIEFAHQIRERSRTLISFGDCAVTGNVTALRNLLGEPIPLLQQVYGAAAEHPRPPGVPALLPRVLPLHAVVPVDLYIPGCPPPAPRIRAALEAVIAGEAPNPQGRAMLKLG